MKRTVQLIGIVAGLMLCASAYADSLRFDGVVGSADVVTYDVPSPLFHASGNYAVGFYTYDLGGPVIYSFCIDFYDTATSTYQNYTSIPLANGPLTTFGSVAMGPAAALTIQRLWGQNYAQALADAGHGNYATAAALQEAIWKAVAQSAGGTSIGTTYEAQASAMLTAAANYTGPLPNLFDWSNAVGTDQWQDYIGVPDGGLTGMLLGIGMLGVGWIRRMVK